MREQFMKMLKKILTTTSDWQDAMLGYERLDSAERKVNDTLRLLEMRRNIIKPERSINKPNPGRSK
jgi:hypothetical protein